jgi:hypothetical protein
MLGLAGNRWWPPFIPWKGWNLCVTFVLRFFTHGGLLLMSLYVCVHRTGFQLHLGYTHLLILSFYANHKLRCKMGINETDLDPKEVFSYKTCTLLDE